MPTPPRPNVSRLLFGGFAAGLVINAIEYLAHGMFLDAQWTAAFATLGKAPTGWTTFIPANFLVGVIAIWVYTRMSPSYGLGPKTAVRAALAVWVVFWVNPRDGASANEAIPRFALVHSDRRRVVG